MLGNNFHIKGLSNEAVLQARIKYGENKLSYKKENQFYTAIRTFIKEPMIVLLLVTSSIYLISGQTGDAIFLACTIILIAAISFFQHSRSHKALNKLKILTQPKCKVIRNNEAIEINSEELVVGDHLIVEEGSLIAADGVIIHSNDFSVNEAILTGESLPVFKDQTKTDNTIYQGTTVASGLAIAIVTNIGIKTRLGKIGKSLETIQEEKTPLELQINNFVKKMVLIGTIIFLIVWLINYFHSYNVLDSLLKGLTLAMSILPEEIPVAFTTFLALGIWRLMHMGIVVKQVKTVETLGSATVICIDKTGTITENQMSLAKVFVLSSQQIISPEQVAKEEEIEVITLGMWASEPIPFDPMEVALHNAYTQLINIDERPFYKMIHEYPLNGTPPMMTHIFEDHSGNRIIAAKGAPEALINVSILSYEEKKQIKNALQTLTSSGYRVLGIGKSDFKGDKYPFHQQQLSFQFKGLVAFYDPPKKNIQSVLQTFYNAGIDVKIVTGDNAITTASIAKQIHFKNHGQSLSGEELIHLQDRELEEKVMHTNIFTRMFPEAKLKIINALKAKGQIVAMTGDGVNDGPALKAAHIGIAMGKKGTEIAKEAASLILTDDDLSKMTNAIAIGRKIYANLKKAIRYIISIHIPIILTVFIPLVFGWIYPHIFSPVHIIFLELIMGPTCSIVYENEPIEENTMLQKPRSFTTTFFNWRELTTSIIQGLMITAGVLFIYQYSVYQGYNELLTRTMVFTTLIASNIFLTLVNRSFYYSITTTLLYKNNLLPFIISITIVIMALLLYVQSLTRFFELQSPNLHHLLLCITTGFFSVIWYELVKWSKRRRSLYP